MANDAAQSTKHNSLVVASPSAGPMPRWLPRCASAAPDRAYSRDARAFLTSLAHFGGATRLQAPHCKDPLSVAIEVAATEFEGRRLGNAPVAGRCLGTVMNEPDVVPIQSPAKDVEGGEEGAQRQLGATLPAEWITHGTLPSRPRDGVSYPPVAAAQVVRKSVCPVPQPTAALELREITPAQVMTAGDYARRVQLRCSPSMVDRPGRRWHSSADEEAVCDGVLLSLDKSLDVSAMHAWLATTTLPRRSSA